MITVIRTATAFPGMTGEAVRLGQRDWYNSQSRYRKRANCLHGLRWLAF